MANIVSQRPGILNPMMAPASDHADREIGSVAIPPWVGHALDGQHLEIPQAAEVLQGLADLPGLVVELSLVTETLPNAAAARPERRAAMRDAFRRWGDDLHGPGFRVAFLEPGDARLDHVAGDGTGHEHDELADLGDAGSAERQVGDGQLDDLALL